MYAIIMISVLKFSETSQGSIKIMQQHTYIINSPLGNIELIEQNGAITHCNFTMNKANNSKITPLLSNATAQLNEYFNGSRHSFDLPLNPAGTIFQQQVWNALVSIPYGDTKSYKEIAKFINQDKAARAVGNANGKNPICIIIPCHRVIASNGTIGGYSSGVDKKKLLLQLEQAEYITNNI